MVPASAAARARIRARARRQRPAEARPLLSLDSRGPTPRRLISRRQWHLRLRRTDEKASSLDATYVSPPPPSVAGLSECRMSAPSALTAPLRRLSLSLSLSLSFYPQHTSTHFISLTWHRPAPRMVEAQDCDVAHASGDILYLKRTLLLSTNSRIYIHIEIKRDLHLLLH